MARRRLRRRYGRARDTRQSTKLLRAAEKIMDKMQSLVLRAGYSTATESERQAVRDYAAASLPRMREIATEMRSSDDPGAVWTVDGQIKRLERFTTYRLGSP